MDFRRIIDNFTQQHNLIAGVTSAKPLTPHKRLTGIPFSMAAEAERRNPSLLLPGAKSVIALGAGYAKAADEPDDGACRGVFSAMAVGEDYHLSMARHLAALRDALLAASAFESVIHVDSGPLCERAFAIRAGLGFHGRNQYIISEKFGPFFNLGLLITTLPITPDAPIQGSCDGCNRCVDACPGGALSADGLDYTRCASFLSQKKGALSAWEQDVLGQALYGCDICARVCPHSAGKPMQTVPLDEIMPRTASITCLSNAVFKEKYGQTAIGWRGAATIRRNAENAVRVYNESQKRGE